jgi:signal transduction histidine kinase/CheY-like chemotaxis protein
MNKKYRFYIAPLIVLFFGFTLVTTFYGDYKKKQYEFAKSEFESRKKTIIIEVQDRVQRYQYGLRGLRGFMIGAKLKPTRSDVISYIQSRNLTQEFQGALGFGFIKRVKENEFDKFKKEMFSLYGKEVPLKSIKEKYKEHFIVEFIEPMEAYSNDKALGLDIATEDKRRNAALLSNESGTGVISDPVKLLQIDYPNQGFLYLMPVYKGNQNITSLVEKDKNLVGWVYTPVIINELLKSILKEFEKDVSIKIFTKYPNTVESMIYSSDSDEVDLFKTRLVFTESFKIGEKIWYYQIYPTQKFINYYLSNNGEILLLIGILFSILVSIVVYILTTSAMRAEIRAHELTNELKNQKEAAEKTYKLKSEFLATISHEIRTPLNGVVGLSELLLETDLSDIQKKYAEGLYKAGRSLNLMINDILDYSKIEAGKLKFEKRLFNFYNICEEVMFLFQKLANDKKLKLTLHIDEAVPKNIIGDEYRIKQILFNLLNNAIKFTKHGSVHLEISALDSNEQNIRLELRVLDTGIGIPLNKQKDIFEMFSQADSSTTREYGGSGLGLAISRMIARQMEGDIQYRNRISGGSEFIVELNLEREAGIFRNIEYKNSDEKKLLVVLKNKRVLIVDDNELNILVASRILDRYFMHLLIAKNGNDCVDIIKKQKVDLVFMDCHMPVMDGYEATEKIRQFESEQKDRKSKIAIVALTANATLEDREKCISSGMDGVLSKPISRKELMKLLIEMYINV